MDINSIKGIKALNILDAYKGLNPYILTLKEEVKKNPNKALTESQYSYVVQNENYEIRKYDKVVEVTQLMGEILQTQERLSFTPKKVMVDYIIGETDKYFHVLGRLTQKQTPKMYMLTKTLIIDDLNFEIKKVNIDFERYNERLLERRGYTLLNHQKEAIQFLLERDGAILADDMGLGKAESVNNLLYTPFGRKRMGDIEPGDKVIGSDGKPTIVEAVFPQGEKEIFRITFDDDFYLDVCGEHLWEVSGETGKYILSTEQMMNENGMHTQGNAVINTYFKDEFNNLKWEIPLVKPIHFELDNKLQIDPYVFGFILGNQPELGIVNLKDKYESIPFNYKTASVDDRLSLLQGLMDSVGTVSYSPEYFTELEHLKDDICELVHTLGGIAQVIDYKDGYRILINLTHDMVPFRNKEKIDAYSKTIKYKLTRRIKSIEPIGKEEAKCIRVSAKDHLYVSNHAIVTHNTTSAIVAALETRYKRVLIVCPSSVKVNWEREIETFSDNTSIINGRSYAQARFTIINPDILQNFHTLDSKVDPNDPPMYLSRELVNSKFDLIIIDEAHTLRNKKSIRGEIMAELCTKFGKPVVWLLTGTPVANRPKDFYNLLKLIRSPLAYNFNHYMTRYCDGRQISKKLANGKTKKIWIANGASNLDELAAKSKHLVLRRLKENVVDMPDKIISNIILDMDDSARKSYERVWDEYLLERERQQKRGNVEREMVELGLLRKFVAMEAIPHTVELAKQAVDDGRKVIIFTTFNDEQQELAEAFGEIAVCHNGSMSVNDKQESVDQFQKNPKVKVFIGNVISAGSGITLTSGTLTIFNSFSWIPGDNEQAEDRSYRIGQKNDCNIYYMVFKDSVSETVLNTIKKKRGMIDQIIDGNNERNINELILETILNG